MFSNSIIFCDDIMETIKKKITASDTVGYFGDSNINIILSNFEKDFRTTRKIVQSNTYKNEEEQYQTEFRIFEKDFLPQFANILYHILKNRNVYDLEKIREILNICVETIKDLAPTQNPIFVKPPSA